MNNELRPEQDLSFWDEVDQRIDAAVKAAISEVVETVLARLGAALDEQAIRT